MPYTYDYPRPMVTVDALLFGAGADPLTVLLIERGNEPFAGRWALPGGFVDMDEDLPLAAARELGEETGVIGIELDQLRTFGAPDRDPRGRSISVVFWAIVDERQFTARGGDDAARAQWFPVTSLPPMAFDHASIIAYAVRRLQWLADRASVGRQVLPGRFTAAELYALHVRVGGRAPDAESLVSRLQAVNALVAEAGATHYRFNPEHVLTC